MQSLGDTQRATTTLTELFTNHRDSVWRSVRRWGVDAAFVDDVVQEVFLVAARKLSQIEAGKERAFVLGIAYRKAKDWRRGQQRRPWHNAEAPEQGSRQLQDGQTPMHNLEQQRGLRLVDEAIKQLEEPLRDVFVLFELEELTMVQIAAMLDLPQGTVASRIRRARSEFTAAVKRLQGEPP